MSSTVLFSDSLFVHYGQFYIEPDDENYIDMSTALSGQENGICGANQPNRLFLVTGLHTGDVHVSVEICAKIPKVDEAWEEIVECSFEQEAERLYLCQWAHEATHLLEIPRGSYRVRYCARAMLGDWQVSEDNDPPQSYLLQFWPSKHEIDVVIKVTGECARYWHAEMAKGRSEAYPSI